MKESIRKIESLKKELGSSLLIAAHHYVNDEIVAVADFVGDSYKLAVTCSNSSAKNIVFCGVTFMAEAAKALSKKSQRVFQPNKDAGCPLADMITGEQFENAFNIIRKKINRTIIPVVYVNSNIDVKGFCGNNDGATCTSSNADRIIEYYLAMNYPVLFAPDFNLGSNTAKKIGLSDEEVMRIPVTGNIDFPSNIHDIKLFLWDGFCYVHKKFTLENIIHLKRNYSNMRVIVHPECNREVVDASDISGSTQQIYDAIEKSERKSTWGVGTEYHFVQRMNKTCKDTVIVPLMESSCKDMQRNDLPNLYDLLLCIRNDDKSALHQYEVHIDEKLSLGTERALQKMIEIVEG